MRALLPILLIPILSGCGASDQCGDTVIETKRDLEGPLVAYRFVRDCGATADYSTHVAIGPADRGVAGATPVFVADPNHGAAEMEGNSIWLEMNWTAPHRLSIAYARGARVFQSSTRAGAATITARATDNRTTLEPQRLPDQGVRQL